MWYIYNRMYKTVDLKRDLFGSAARAGILELLLLHPRERFYLRQMANRLGIAVGSVQQEAPRLVRMGIAVQETDGNRVYFRADPESPMYSELRGLFLKFGGLAQILRDALRKRARSIRWAFIFGSIAKGTEDAWSDVDLLVVGAITDFDLAGLLRKARNQCGRTINSVHYGVEELQEKIGAGEHFVTSVLRGPRILLLGDEDELAALPRGRPIDARTVKPKGTVPSARLRGSLHPKRPGSGP